MPEVGKEDGIVYKELLVKYMTHLGEVEGSLFLSDSDRAYSDRWGVTFTDEQWSILKKIEMSDKENNNA